MQYRLNDRCTNNHQEEQMAILKALEYIQQTESDEKIELVQTDRQPNNASVTTKREKT